ncbi:hypothetical protein BOX15_Mlig033203g2 [Macrostomum lignano]|uniref:Uncharacterized protein n=1 Tax=Macrostomum lignano TaxID=282301 RepID=A0A267F3K1_9PLAT|nr:hypothetical protein BOX15_Mlig033203g1 [Macrostomum lignano]PAA67794.1 hypothetical protein BOX15_Mlig033203g2 [Macrostomum lignano]
MPVYSRKTAIVSRVVMVAAFISCLFVLIATTQTAEAAIVRATEDSYADLLDAGAGGFDLRSKRGPELMMLRLMQCRWYRSHNWVAPKEMHCSKLI